MKTINILVTGRPGTGKTWLMKKLIHDYNINKEGKVGLIHYLHNNRGIAITGKYEGEVFDGSDRLSMAAISSVRDYLDSTDFDVNIFEGDRFTNQTFLKEADPFVVNIEGDGSEGIKMRGSSQTEKRLKSMKTRYNNFMYSVRVPNSDAALELVREVIGGDIDIESYPLLYGTNQQTLF